MLSCSGLTLEIWHRVLDGDGFRRSDLSGGLLVPSGLAVFFYHHGHPIYFLVVVIGVLPFIGFIWLTGLVATQSGLQYTRWLFPLIEYGPAAGQFS